MKNQRQERVFVNSYTMKQATDDDVKFRVDLGRVHSNVFRVELQQAILENKFCNFYDSQGGDFRDLSFSYTNGGTTTYRIFIDQFLTILNLNTIVQQKTGRNFQIKFSNDTLYGDATTVLRLRDVAGRIFTPIGFGWTKLGFELRPYTFSLAGIVDASFLPDFG
jgi:hypothetical protein